MEYGQNNIYSNLYAPLEQKTYHEKLPKNDYLNDLNCYNFQTLMILENQKESLFQIF